MPEYISLFSSPEGKAEIMHAYQVVTDHWPVACQELTVPTSFGDTYVLASGPKDAPPVVLLHALFATAASWYRNVEALSRSYRVYAVDIVGEANKSRATRPIKSLDDFLQWFTELIDGLGIRTLYVAGNSYGGFTAAYYAMKLPDRIRKLVLIGPASTIYSMRPFYIHMFLPKLIYSFFPKLPGLKPTMQRSVRWMHHGLPFDPLWEPLFYRVITFGGLINQVMPRVYSKEEFDRIRAKVLLIFGEKEVIYNNLNSAVRAARDLIPNAEIELVPGAHHIAALAQPETVNQRMLQFFASVEEREERTASVEPVTMRAG